MFLLWFVFGLVLIISVHELGHLVAARLCGMRVHEYCIGHGTRLFGFRFGETEYAFKLNIIFGGYVLIAGMQPGKRNEPGGFYTKSWFSQVFVLSAGVLANFALAAVLFAWALLLTPGDGGTPSLIEAVSGGIRMTGNMVAEFAGQIPQRLWELVTLTEFFKEEAVQEDVQLSKEALTFVSSLMLIGSFSILVGVWNLLPIPMLDGGKIALVSIEALRGKPFTEGTTRIIYGIGSMLFMGLTALVVVTAIFA